MPLDCILPLDCIRPRVGIFSLLLLLLPTVLAGPNLRTLSIDTRTTTLVSSSTTTYITISTEYITPTANPAPQSSETSQCSSMGTWWATNSWSPPTYTWKKLKTTGSRTSHFYPTAERTSIRYPSPTGRPGYTTHSFSSASSTYLQPQSPQIPGREIHPDWNSRWCLTVRGGVFMDGTPVEMYFLLSTHLSFLTHPQLISVIDAPGSWANGGNSGEMVVQRFGQRKRISVWMAKLVCSFRWILKH
jgi:hypothetical protein